MNIFSMEWHSPAAVRRDRLPRGRQPDGRVVRVRAVVVRVVVRAPSEAVRADVGGARYTGSHTAAFAW